ncbi:SHOCT domain-containing protein [Thermophagus sp. OGC60D27]|uniref:SHOCT domain-containing protein n=1 Tax=Thermophagus sp. OGC60D27 TaxID=3458415 RepID=UPI004037A8F3
MQNQENKIKKTKKSAGAWTIGWGWFIAVPALWWLSKKAKRVLQDDEDQLSPLAIIKKRYAKGEIDRKEYEEKLKDLSLDSMGS